MSVRIALAASLAVGVCAADDQARPPSTERERLSYSLGYQIGNDFRRHGVEFRPEALTRGIADTLNTQGSLMTPAAMSAALSDLKRKIRAGQALDSHRLIQQQSDQDRRFLEENAKREGVVSLASGVQYRVLRPGSGTRPGALDRVLIQYRATLTNGVEFDSTYSDGQPLEAGLNEVVPGWREGLQLMQEGAQWQILIPSHLSYGGRGPLAGRTVILEIELLKVLGNQVQSTARPTGDDSP